MFAGAGSFGLIGIVVALVNAAKEKLWWALVSLVFWPAGVVAAFRLGKPHSIWARRFYRDGRRQASEARYGVAGADETPGSGDSGAPAADSAPAA